MFHAQWPECDGEAMKDDKDQRWLSRLTEDTGRYQHQREQLQGRCHCRGTGSCEGKTDGQCGEGGSTCPGKIVNIVCK